MTIIDAKQRLCQTQPNMLRSDKQLGHLRNPLSRRVSEAQRRTKVLGSLLEGGAHAAAVLVDFCGSLALAHARLDAMARVCANGLEGEGEGCFFLHDSHLGAATMRQRGEEQEN